MLKFAVILVVLAMAGSAVAHRAATPPRSTGGWDILDTSSEPQPRPWEYDATLFSDGQISTRFPDERVVFDVKCDGSGASVWVEWPKDVRAVPSDHRTTTVVWALDGQAEQKTTFLVGKDEDDGPGVYLADQSAFKWFTALKAGKILAVRVGDGRAGQRVTFHLNGIRAVAATFKPRNCGSN
jgi:hypothetical protein